MSECYANLAFIGVAHSLLSISRMVCAARVHSVRCVLWHAASNSTFNEIKSWAHLVVLDQFYLLVRLIIVLLLRLHTLLVVCLGLYAAHLRTVL